MDSQNNLVEKKIKSQQNQIYNTPISHHFIDSFQFKDQLSVQFLFLDNSSSQNQHISPSQLHSSKSIVKKDILFNQQLEKLQACQYRRSFFNEIQSFVKIRQQNIQNLLNKNQQDEITSKLSFTQDINVQNFLINDNQDKFPNIFKFQKIKGKYHKNTNVPKALVRIYIKYYHNFLTNKIDSRLKYYHLETKKKIMNRKTNNYKIAHIIQLIEAGSSDSSNASLINRQNMSNIIRKTIKQEVILNNFVKGNQMSYMIAMKVYALRCRSKSLVQRVKIL